MPKQYQAAGFDGAQRDGKPGGTGPLHTAARFHDRLLVPLREVHAQEVTPRVISQLLHHVAIGLRPWPFTPDGHIPHEELSTTSGWVQVQKVVSRRR
jgi:hypothetical protein